MDSNSRNPKQSSQSEAQSSSTSNEKQISSTNKAAKKYLNPDSETNASKKTIGDDIYNLPEHVKFLFEPISNTSNFDGFDLEFKYIEKKSAELEKTQTYIHANKPINQLKNRYYNVLPPDQTRVKLSQIDGVEGSDYINANFADISNSEYICTQGPLPETVGDFWRMIWECRSYVILMLTQEIEQNRVKCCRYWPEGNEPMTVDNFIITLKSKETPLPDIICRRFILTKQGSQEKREIVHFQWISWPDYGSPDSTSNFLKLISMVDAANVHRGLITVHCSAGIGRSGTFCCVHATVNMMNEYVKKYNKLPPINVIRTILKLREYRPGIVQSKEQYIFVYLAILEHWNALSAKLNAAKQQNNNSSQNDIYQPLPSR